MKNIILISALLLSFSLANAQDALLSKSLNRALTISEDASALHHIIVTFSNQVPMADWLYRFEAAQTPLEQRAKQVIRMSMELSNSGKAAFVPEIEAIAARSGHEIALLDYFWIVNAAEVQANKVAILALQQLPGIAEIELVDAVKFELLRPTEEAFAPEAPNGREPGLTAIGAPQLWAMGYTGKARRALLIDTGVWPRHTAIQGAYLGNRFPLSETWLPYIVEQPADKAGNHGTHVIGTVLGLDTASNDTIGVAFGAYFIATDPVNTGINILGYVRSFEWALNPDGDTSTVHDIPDVINNSWGRTHVGNDTICNQPLMLQTMLAVEAAGIANVFSAGNAGPGPSTIGFLSAMAIDTLNVFSIGALNGSNPSFPIAGFSSRGPTICPVDSMLAIKPEVSAPGVSVRSADGQTGYGSKSGTSMAAPHVSGAVLLLKEAFPEVSGRQILNALYQTAIDLGVPGEDNVYGRGIINVPAAFNFLANTFTPTPPASRAFDIAIMAVDSPSTLQLADNCEGHITHPPATARVTVMNLGLQPISNFDIAYEHNGLFGTQSFTQSIPSGGSVEVLVAGLSRVLGSVSAQNVWRFKAVLPGQTEADTINNHYILSFDTKSAVSTALTEDFNPVRGPGFVGTHALSDWSIVDVDQDEKSWEFVELIGPDTSTTTAAGVLMRSYGLRQGQLDELYTPVVTYSSADDSMTLLVQFDVAYGPRNSSFRDSLFVDYSADCGLQFTRLYSNGGDSLKSYTGVDPASPADWRRIELQTRVASSMQRSAGKIRFTTRNDFGGNLYITNVFYGYIGAAHVQEIALPKVRLYPNPSSGRVTISSPDAAMNQVLILDMQGRLLQQHAVAAAHSTELDLATLPEGMYIVRINTNQGIVNTRLVKN